LQERVLLEPMYEAPGSGVTAVLIDADVVMKKRSPVLFVGSEMVQVWLVSAALWGLALIPF
jgi:ATP-dependent protease Clp ATPase subunit